MPPRPTPSTFTGPPEAVPATAFTSEESTVGKQKGLRVDVDFLKNALLAFSSEESK
jgi:hypothetical protein